MIFVTGGAGFIGCNLIRLWLATQSEPVLNIDKLSYAGNLNNLADLQHDPRYQFVQADIIAQDQMVDLLRSYQPRAIVHLAAETHVDRALNGPANFIQSNIAGTFSLLEASRHYWQGLPPIKQHGFRFLQVSTDEVFGSLAANAPAFDEQSPYAPNNPYAASKAAADHLVRAYHHSYGLPTLISHSCNNYGPHQFPEKLIPFMIQRALHNQTLPIYGNGQHSRDWLHVSDHCLALLAILERGIVGAHYCVGARHEMRNQELVEKLCALLDELRPHASGGYAELIRRVADRPGHDERYALNPNKINTTLGWQAQQNFDGGLRKTVEWYLANHSIPAR